MENTVAFCPLNENEASVSASVILIHSRPEDSSDSDCDSDSASVASVNMVLTIILRKDVALNASSYEACKFSKFIT